MQQPTDRMLIDAICICLADLYGLTNRQDGANAALYNKAREIVGRYAPMAMALILREQEQAKAPMPEEERQRRLEGSEYEIYQRTEGANAGKWDVPGDAGCIGRFDTRREAENYVLGVVDSPELTDEQLSRLRPARPRPTEVRRTDAAGDSVIGTIERGVSFNISDRDLAEKLLRRQLSGTAIGDHELAELAELLGRPFTDALPVDGRRYIVSYSEDRTTSCKPPWRFRLAELHYTGAAP